MAVEEVTILVDAEDEATPTLSQVGRSMAMLAVNVAWVTRALGDQSPAAAQLSGALLTFAHLLRMVTALKTLYIAVAGSATAANYGLAASFAAVNAAMGPLGWALIGLGLLGAGVAGYALAGGFGGGAAGRPAVAGVGQGPFREPLTQTIIVNVDKIATKQEVKELVDEMATLWYQEMRRYRD